MESTLRYWIPVFDILKNGRLVTLAQPKYTKPQNGNMTDRKDAKWICSLFMCDMIRLGLIPPPDIHQFRDLMRYSGKLSNILTGEKARTELLHCL